MLSTNISNVLSFTLFILTVNCQIELIPRVRISTTVTTKFYLFNNKKLDHSKTICHISLVEGNNRNKRSISDLTDFRKGGCQYTRPKLKPSSLIKYPEKNADFVTENAESITLEDLPTTDSDEFTDSSIIDDEKSITTKPDLFQPKLQPRSKFDLSRVEETVEKIEKLSDWQLNYDSIGENIQILHLKYMQPVESIFKAKYEIECREDDTQNTTQKSHLILILKPYNNLTQNDSITNKEFVDFSHYLEEPPCSCDLTFSMCDKNCCCDQNCSIDALELFGCSKPFYKTGKYLQQPTGFECTSRSISFLCVHRKSTSFIDRFYQIESILKTPKEYDKRIKIDKKMQILTNPPLFYWTTDHYKQTTPIQIKLENNDFAVWTIPKSFFGHHCTQSSPVLFQINHQSKCVTKVNSNCDLNQFLNINFHLPWKSGSNSTFRYQFPQDLFTNSFATVNVTYKCVNNYDFHSPPLHVDCDINLMTSSNGSHCINSVIESKYNFHWQGTKIHQVDIILVIQPFVDINETIKQHFEVNFIHNSSANNLKETKEEMKAVLSTFQPDSNGFCLQDFSPVEIGESILTSCRLKVDYLHRQSCSNYRSFLCQKFEDLWELISTGVNKIDEILLLNPNFTLCDTSFRMYNTCLLIPTDIIIEVAYADLAKVKAHSFRLFGIRMRLKSTACYPPVGYGKEKTDLSMSETENGNENENEIENELTILCNPSSEVIIGSNIKFILLHQNKYIEMIEDFRNRLTIFHYVHFYQLFREEFFPLFDKYSEPVTHIIAIAVFISVLFLVTALFLYSLKRK